MYAIESKRNDWPGPSASVYVCVRNVSVLQRWEIEVDSMKKLKDNETQKYIYLFMSTMKENNNCPKLSIKTNIYVSPSSHFC